MSNIDINDLALSQSVLGKTNLSKKPRIPRHQVGEKFLKGPIPLNWICCAAQLPGKSFQVAIAIWFLSGLNNKATVKLNQTLLDKFGVTRQCKYRALQWLSGAHLIGVDQPNGKNPSVTILEIDGVEP